MTWIKTDVLKSRTKKDVLFSFKLRDELFIVTVLISNLIIMISWVAEYGQCACSACKWHRKVLERFKVGTVLWLAPPLIEFKKIGMICNYLRVRFWYIILLTPLIKQVATHFIVVNRTPWCYSLRCCVNDSFIT